VLRHEHDLGRRHVEPVVVEPGQPGLAGGDVPGHGRGLALRLTGDRELCGERAGVRSLALDDGDPSRPRQCPGIDQVDPLRGLRLEQSPQHGAVSGDAVVLRELARDFERDRADRGAAELGEEPPEDLGERQVGRDCPGRLGVSNGALTA
jgi:hypothetical protein